MKLLKIFAAMVFLIMAIYLALPSPNFPQLPPGSIQSIEPGDTESIYRRAYYTNLTREEIMAYYFQQFGGWGLQIILPPEEAQTVIRDQTKSSYLEEIIHPGREVLYVNAFVPQLPKDQININKVHYLNKVAVRMVPSHVIGRLTMLLLVTGASLLLFKEYVDKK